MILSDDDIMVLSYIVDNPKCSITDIIKATYNTENTEVFKRMDNRLRNRLKEMVEDRLIFKLNGYNPARYQANPEQVFKGHGGLACVDLDDRVRSLDLDDYIVVAGPENRIVIRPLKYDNWENADENGEDA